MDIGLRIKKYLTRKGITQKWLSRQTGLKSGRLYDYLNQRTKMPLSAYIKIVNALNVNADFFINDWKEE